MDGDTFNIDDFLPYLLTRAAEAASARFSEVYKSRYGLLRTDWRVLFHLGAAGELAARDIAVRAGEDKTQVSRAVARLEARGWLRRRRDTADRRTERLALTDAGKRVFADLRSEAAAHDAALVSQFGVAELERLRRTLEKLAHG